MMVIGKPISTKTKRVDDKNEIANLLSQGLFFRSVKAEQWWTLSDVLAEISVFKKLWDSQAARQPESAEPPSLLGCFAPLCAYPRPLYGRVLDGYAAQLAKAS